MSTKRSGVIFSPKFPPFLNMFFHSTSPPVAVEPTWRSVPLSLMDVPSTETCSWGCIIAVGKFANSQVFTCIYHAEKNVDMYVYIYMRLRGVYIYIYTHESSKALNKKRKVSSPLLPDVFLGDGVLAFWPLAVTDAHKKLCCSLRFFGVPCVLFGVHRIYGTIVYLPFIYHTSGKTCMVNKFVGKYTLRPMDPS